MTVEQLVAKMRLLKGGHQYYILQDIIAAVRSDQRRLDDARWEREINSVCRKYMDFDIPHQHLTAAIAAAKGAETP